MSHPSISPTVLYIGDSRKMKGGINAVITAIETTFIWEKYGCEWLECQINRGIVIKLLFWLHGLFKGLLLIPRHDIIHFHTAGGRSMKVLFPFFVYARLLRKVIVVQLHIGDQLETESKGRVFKYYCRNARLVITLGESFKRFVPVSDRNSPLVEALYNPAPLPSHKGSAEKYFLSAAFFDSEMNKGYDILLASFSLTLTHHPEWKLVLCGDGDMDRVRAIVDKYQLKDSVVLPGWVTGHSKTTLFQNAYAYCLTSRKEGLPMSVLESLSFGLPVITTPVGSLPEILTDNLTALFVDIGDIGQLSRQMCRLIEDQELYNRLSDNALHLVESNLSIDRFARRLDGLYGSL